jgi:predicted Zn-dependent peptidase/LysM repeat protein
MRRHRLPGSTVLAAAALSVVLCAGAARAEGDGAVPVAGTDSAPPLLALSRRTLPNGLRVVLHEDHSVPNVAVCVTYDVGSRNETEGQSGFAHLFEHLMFEGSRNVPKGGHFLALSERGGRGNGTTNKERTNYYEVVPSNGLSLALWLEADRMQSLALNRTNFENQRRVVEEEYRMRYDNRVFAQGLIRLGEIVYEGDYAYQHPTIGYIDELDAARFEWARDFHDTYYLPNNAVLSVAGDFELEVANRLIDEHFGDIESGPRPPSFESPGRAEQGSERFNVMVDEAAKSPAVFMGWAIPPARTKERLALELAAEVLTGGQSGRLYQSLVIEKGSALSVDAWTSGQRSTGQFTIRTVVAPLSNADTAEKWLDGELKRLRLIGPSEDELDRARARLETSLLRQLETNQRRAISLGQYEVFFGDANLLRDDLSRYRGITRQDVKAAAFEYLKDIRRSIVEVYPPGWTRDLGPVITTTTYVVQKGDTLIGIAKRHGTSAQAIAKENRISVGKPIHPGQRLLVTLGAGGGPKVIVKKHEVKKGDTLIGIAKKYGTTASAIAKENKISTKKPIYPGQELTITLEVSSSHGHAKPSNTQRSTSKKVPTKKAAPKKAAPKKAAPKKAAPKKAAPKKK